MSYHHRNGRTAHRLLTIASDFLPPRKYLSVNGFHKTALHLEQFLFPVLFLLSYGRIQTFLSQPFLHGKDLIAEYGNRQMSTALTLLKKQELKHPVNFDWTQRLLSLLSGRHSECGKISCHLRLERQSGQYHSC